MNTKINSPALWWDTAAV